MAIPAPPEAAVFFVGVLAAGQRELALAGDCLAREFGMPARSSPAWPFSATQYYRDELGPEPLRAFFAFPGLFPPDRLAERKLRTNRLEEELARAAGLPLSRPINLDPGYLTPAKLVLASAKNYAHRIYLANGIYAEVTLQYTKGGFKSLPWTFPDFASGKYFAFFRELRAVVHPVCARQFVKMTHTGDSPSLPPACSPP